MKATGLIVLFIMLMAAFGWASSGISSTIESFDAREWSVIGLDQLDPQDIKMAAEKATGSDIFPGKTDSDQQDAGALEPGNVVSGLTEFPEIGGVSIIDGAPHLLLWLQNEGPKYFSVGDDVDENWSIIKLDMQEVIAFSLEDEQEYNFFITGSHLIVDSEN